LSAGPADAFESPNVRSCPTELAAAEAERLFRIVCWSCDKAAAANSSRPGSVLLSCRESLVPFQ